MSQYQGEHGVKVLCNTAVCVCVCVCVRERAYVRMRVLARKSVCVRVCVCMYVKHKNASVAVLCSVALETRTWWCSPPLPNITDAGILKTWCVMVT